MWPKRIDSQVLISKTPPTSPPKWLDIHEILVHSLKGSARSFVIGYSTRAGISFLVKLFQSLRKKAKISLVETLFNLPSLRFAGMLSSFSFLFKLISNSLLFYRKKYDKKNGAIAGGVAGLAILWESKGNRIAISQQFFFRALLASKNALKQRYLLDLPYGDAFLFGISCASIMYAYTMFPHTIPKSYYSWIVQHGRVPKALVELNRECSFGHRSTDEPITFSTAKVLSTIDKFNPTSKNRSAMIDYVEKHQGVLPNIPCICFHSSYDYCTNYCLSVFGLTFMEMLPVYLALNTVPTFILKTREVLNFPGQSLKRAIYGSLQSTSFLAAYVTLFQSGLCGHRNLLPDSREPRYFFYGLGFLASFASILLEQNSKRTEFVMYVMPKGLQSLYELSISKGVMFTIPYLDVIGSCFASSIIMGLIQKEPHQLSPFLYKVLKNVIGTY